MSNLFIPSYAQGFACSAAESENPGLWKGLLGLWAPTLGVTGLTLHDQSAFKKNATIVNATNTTWTFSKYGSALAFDGNANTGLTFPGISIPNGGSLVCLFRHTDLAGANRDPLIYTQYHYNGLMVHNNIVYGRYGSTATSYAAISQDIWYHVVFTVDRSYMMRLYLDGRLRMTTGPETSDSHPLVYLGRNPGNSAYLTAEIATASIYDRPLFLNEIQQLYADSDALLRPRRRVFASVAAPPSFVPYPHPLISNMSGGLAV